MTYGETIKEIDEDLTRLTDLLKTGLNDGDKREARANIDKLLEERSWYVNKSIEVGMEILLKNSFCVGPIETIQKHNKGAVS